LEVRRIVSIREEFERVRRVEIEAYEAKLKLRSQHSQQKLERERLVREQTSAIAKRYGLDVSLLQGIHEREAKELAPFLEEFRPALANRQVTRGIDDQVQVKYGQVFERLKANKAEFVGAYLLAPKIADFEGISGERGNPWLFPADPKAIRVGMSDTGDGSGCWGGWVWAPLEVHTSTFSFVPDKDGLVKIQPLILPHGFYIVKADDTCFSCKSAHVHASVELSTVQDGIWAYGQQPAVLVDREGDNIFEQATIDQAVLSMSCERVVIQKRPVYIYVKFYIGVQARGGGSYAEVNFKTGQNWISCPQVWWYPSPGLWGY
jgi:hypothetical protein